MTHLLRSEIKEDTVYRGGLSTHSPRLVTEIKGNTVTFRMKSLRSKSGWTRIQYVTTLEEFAEWAVEVDPVYIHDTLEETK